jgi:hypothetical protein
VSGRDEQLTPNAPFVIQSGREIRTEAEWLAFAGPKEGEKQWEHGFSAMESARAWLRRGKPAVPDELAALLESTRETSSFRPLYAIPELVTRLDEFGGEDRNHDVAAVGIARAGPTLVAVEAKAREQFGPLVGKHYEAGREKKGSNIPERIRRLVHSLFGPDAIDGDEIIKPYADLRYQLLTALAGTLIEARRRFVDQAVLLVHEFTSRSGPGGYVGTNKAGLARNADDWAAFIRALHSSPADGGALVGPLFIPGSEVVPAEMPFFLGKATCPLGDDAARRWLADRAGPARGKPPTAPPLDPARGAEAARKLRGLGVKGILIKAAELGYITQVTCKMPECFCPEELGGARYFEPVTLPGTDWMPTLEHFPRPKREGGHRSLDNAVLAHRLCNRIDYSITVGRSYARDLERIRKAREAARR